MLADEIGGASQVALAVAGGGLAQGLLDVGHRAAIGFDHVAQRNRRVARPIESAHYIAPALSIQRPARYERLSHPLESRP